jgi:hypothetical protein
MRPRIFAGRYDARFLGVVIRAESLEEMNGFRLLDRDSKVPVEILLRLDDDDLVTDLSRISVEAHETRHFHDALLYPMGAAALRLRVFAAINAFRVARALTEIYQEGQVVPLPLHEWLASDSQDRNRFAALSLNRAGRTGESFLELPYMDADDILEDLPRGTPIMVPDEQYLTTACRLAHNSYVQIQRLWRAPYDLTGPSEAAAINFWEASGLLSQHSYLSRVAGRRCSGRFMTAVVERVPAYRDGLDTLAGVVGGQISEQMNSRLWGALVAWSQLGRFKDEAQESSPFYRLVRLGEALRKGMRWSLEDSFADIVQRWDGSVGTDSFAALDDSSRELGLLAGRLETRAKDAGPDPGNVEWIAARQMRAFEQAHLAMKASFLSDPDGYVDTAAYVNAMERYPSPAIAVSLSVRGDRGPIEDWFDVTPPGRNPVVPFDTALDFTTAVLLTDALFLSSTKTRQQHTEDVVQRFFGWQTRRLISLHGAG